MTCLPFALLARRPPFDRSRSRSDALARRGVGSREQGASQLHAGESSSPPIPAPGSGTCDRCSGMLGIVAGPPGRRWLGQFYRNAANGLTGAAMTDLSIPLALLRALAVIALVGAASATAMAYEPPLPPPRPQEVAPPAKPAEAPPAPEAPKAEATSTCLVQLIADGASAEAATAPPASAQGCGISAPRKTLVDHGGRRSSEFARPPPDRLRIRRGSRGLCPPHRCAARPGDAARQNHGNRHRSRLRLPQPDRTAGAKISAHAKGLAVDFIAVAIADKQQILVERQAGPEETAYFRAMRTAACGWFTTVLGPGSDAFHANNLHLDIEPHGSSGSYRICQ